LCERPPTPPIFARPPRGSGAAAAHRLLVVASGTRRRVGTEPLGVSGPLAAFAPRPPFSRGRTCVFPLLSGRPPTPPRPPTILAGCFLVTPRRGVRRDPSGAARSP